jgi:integrase
MAIRRRVTGSGEVRWDVTLYRADRSRFGRSFPTKRSAEAWQRDQLRARDRGEWIDPDSGRVLVHEWAAVFIEREGIRDKTRHHYRATLERHVLPTLGRRPIGSVAPADAQRVITSMVGRGYAPNTVRGTASVMRALFTAAMDADLIGRSPCRGLKVPAAPPADEVGRALASDEVWALHQAMDDRYRAAVLVGALTGLRISEILGLQVGDLDLLRATLSVRRALVDTAGRLSVTPPKSKAGQRTMALPAVLVEELAAHMARRQLTAARPTAWLFASPTGLPMRYSSWMRQWRAALERSGVEHCTPHDLRRTNATELVAAGVDVKTAQTRLGHADPRLTFGLYARSRQQSDSLAADALDLAFTDRRLEDRA